MDELLSQYYSLVDRPDRTSPEALRQLTVVLASIVKRCSREEAVELFRQLVEGTELNPMGSRAAAFAGYHIGSFLAEDPALAHAVHLAFLQETNEAVLTMWTEALVAVAAYPPDRLDLNIIDGFEYDMFDLAKRAHEQHLVSTLLYKLPRTCNDALLREAFDWCLRTQPEYVVVAFIDLVLEAEQRSRNIAAERGDWEPSGLADSRTRFCAALVDYSLQEMSNNRLFQVISQLEKLGSVDSLKDLRQKLPPQAYPVDLVGELEKAIVRLGG